MTTEEDNEDSEPEEILQITQINKITPDNKDQYGVEIKNKRKKPKVHHRHRLSGHNHAEQSHT